MTNKIAVLVISLSVLCFFTRTTPVHAAKPFVAKKAAVRKTTSRGFVIPVSVRFRPDRRGILFSFTNFSGIESVSYSFTYTTNGQPQGAGGTITSGNDPSSNRELLFGTCSTAVCTYHSNLANSRLVFTAKLANGGSATRAFRIKTTQ